MNLRDEFAQIGDIKRNNVSIQDRVNNRRLYRSWRVTDELIVRAKG